MPFVRITFLGLFAALLCVPLAFAQNADIDEVGKNPVTAKFVSGGRIKMSLCPGGVEITGKDDNRLRVEYSSREDDDQVRVRLQVSGDHATLQVSECPNGNFKLWIEVPKSSDLYLRMYAGELNVEGVRGDKDAELHFGHMMLDVGKAEEIGHVDASVLSGDLEVPPFDVSKGGLFRSFEHHGSGKLRIHAHVAAGKLELR